MSRDRSRGKGRIRYFPSGGSTPPVTPSFLLKADNTSFLLQSDNVSKIQKAT